MLALAAAAHLWLACPAASAHSLDHCQNLLRDSMEASQAGSGADVLRMLRDIEVGCPRYMGGSVATHAIRQQGEMYLRLKEPRQALNQAERCLSKDRDAGCLFVKGRALLDLGQRDDGLRVVSLAIAAFEGEIEQLWRDPPSATRDLNIAHLESLQNLARHYLRTEQ